MVFPLFLFLVCVTITVVIPLFGDKKPTFDAAIKASITSAGASVRFRFRRFRR